ncbi:MAG TPA: hypothetical protein DDZ89_07920 [Clostridiales bacterium]|nr:hypothetical protein [Clostridiales bacterium]
MAFLYVWLAIIFILTILILFKLVFNIFCLFRRRKSLGTPELNNAIVKVASIALLPVVIIIQVVKTKTK